MRIGQHMKRELQVGTKYYEDNETWKMEKNGDEDNELVEVDEELKLNKDQKAGVKQLVKVDRRRVQVCINSSLKQLQITMSCKQDNAVEE